MIKRQFLLRTKVAFRLPVSQSTPYQLRTYSRMSLADKAIPVFTAGRSADVGRAVKERLLPDYDVIHISLSMESVKEELTRVLRGEHVIPSSGLGSNIDRPADARRIPKLIAVGGGFSAEEYEDMKKSIDLTGGGKLAGNEAPIWVKRNVGSGSPKGPDGSPIDIKLPSGEFSPAFVDVIISNVKSKLDEAAKEAGLV